VGCGFGGSRWSCWPLRWCCGGLFRRRTCTPGRRTDGWCWTLQSLLQWVYARIEALLLNEPRAPVLSDSHAVSSLCLLHVDSRFTNVLFNSSGGFLLRVVQLTPWISPSSHTLTRFFALTDTLAHTYPQFLVIASRCFCSLSPFLLASLIFFNCQCLCWLGELGTHPPTHTRARAHQHHNLRYVWY
jgi:hypothetical protein